MLVDVLAADPDLASALRGCGPASGLPPAVARVYEIPAGPWPVRVSNSIRPLDLGLLVLDGLLLREVTFVAGESGELVGPRDVLRPWEDETATGALRSEAAWTALTPVRLAVLDRDFAHAIAPWPEVWTAVCGRLLQRARRLGVLLALSHIPRLEPRLLGILWFLSEHWGEELPDGARVSLPLTHRTLGVLVGARRPSVTRSMSALTRKGLITQDRGGFVLHGDAPAALALLMSADEQPAGAPT